MIKHIFLKYKTIIGYLFFGGLTTLINIIVFYVCDNNLHLYYQTANLIAWVISVLFAFFTNKIWVFNSKFTTTKLLLIELGWFIFYRIISLGLDSLIMFIGISILSVNSLLTKIFDQIFIVILNYIFSKFIIFKKRH